MTTIERYEERSKEIEIMEERMEERRMKRKEVVEKYSPFVSRLCRKLPDGTNPKGITYRRFLKSALCVGAMNVFTNEEEEYRFVGKIGRGIFNDKMRTSGFSEGELFALDEMAKAFGAYDY